MLRAFALALLCSAATAAPVKLERHVTDLTGTLSAGQQAQLEAQLVALEQRKGSQVAVYMVPTLGDRALEDYVLEVAEGNRLGRDGVDDGVLLFIAKDDRKVRIEVGYGLEGAIPDAKAGRIIREYLAPNFRKGDYHQGITEAVAALTLLIDGEALPPPLAEEPKAPPSTVLALVIGLVVGLLAAGTRMKPVWLRRTGAGLSAFGLAWVLFSAGTGLLAAVIAFFVASSGPGRFSSGHGSWGSFPGGGSGWGGGGFGGGGGWGGGGGGFGGGGASGGW